MDSEQTTQRIKLGDQLETPREVEHFGIFAARTAAATAAAELTAEGFQVTVSRRGLRTFVLEARISSPVDLETVDVVVEQVYSIVGRHGGIYDGWGGPVVLRGKQ